MKITQKIIIICSIALQIILQGYSSLYGQTKIESSQIDSLRNIYLDSPSDSNKIKIYYLLIDKYNSIDNYTAKKMIDTAMSLSVKYNYASGIARSYRYYGFNYYYLGDFENAIKYFFKSIKKYEEIGSNSGIGAMYNNLGGIYFDLKLYDYSIKFFRLAVKYNLMDKRIEGVGIGYTNIAEAFRNLNILDSSFYYYNKSLDLLRNTKILPTLAYSNLADLYLDINQYDKVESNLDTALSFAKRENSKYNISNVYWVLSKYKYKLKKLPEAYEAICIAEENCKNTRVNQMMLQILSNKADIFNALNSKDSALVYYKKINELQQILYNESTALKAIRTNTKNYLDKTNLEIENLTNINIVKSKYLTYLVIGIIILLCALILNLILLAKNKKLSKSLIHTNQVISFQNSEILTKNDDNRLRLSEINQLNSELIRSNESKDTIISIIAHDIKNPLTGIYGLADLIANYKEELNEDDIKSLSNSIKAGTSHLNNLLENLLLWASATSNRNEVCKQEIDIQDLIKTILELFSYNAKQKNITIIDSTDNCVVFVDKNMLMTVIRNLLSNAIKFSNPNSEILFSSEISEDNLKISIKDSGVGISPDKLDELFEVSINKSTYGTNQEKGSGLGLVLCRDFVRLNDGEIWVESEAGKGTNFSFTVPLYKKIQANN